MKSKKINLNILINSIKKTLKINNYKLGELLNLKSMEIESFQNDTMSVCPVLLTHKQKRVLRLWKALFYLKKNYPEINNSQYLDALRFGQVNVSSYEVNHPVESISLSSFISLYPESPVHVGQIKEAVRSIR